VHTECRFQMQSSQNQSHFIEQTRGLAHLDKRCIAPICQAAVTYELASMHGCADVFQVRFSPLHSRSVLDQILGTSS